MSCPVAHDADAAVNGGAAGRKRIQTACEACRVAKIRCLPSDQSGVCQKCLVSKKECVSRTGPRRRRPNKSKLPLGDELPPPPKPSGTFTINIPLARPAEPSPSSLDTLRDSHAAYIDNLFPPDPTATPSFPSSSAASSASPFAWMSSIASEAASSPSTAPPPSADMHAQPTFNITSAESLLATFRSMLSYCPVVLLPADVTVRELAQSRPFVLLAILAAAAGAKSLQGHNLYDEEFRKVFALKLVAGGERSLELLQGILIYCLWYPFHLRPKVKQVFQYTRMAADLVHDLELDVDTRAAAMEEPMTPERLDSIRAYIAQYYLSSSFAVTWQVHRSAPVVFTSWTEHCCTLLSQHAETPGDVVLASLARLGHTVRDAWAAVRDTRGSGDEANSTLVFRGLEAQFKEQQESLSPAVTETLPIKLQTLFTEFFLLGGSVLRMPSLKPPPQASVDPFRPTLARISACVLAVGRFLSLLASISAGELAHFSAGDWGRLVLAVVVAMRLSFPLAECPELDSAWAREQLGFRAFLDVMTREADAAVAELTTAAKRVDVVSASRVVMMVVREKYEKRLAVLERQQREEQRAQAELELPRPRCPMLDGSLESYFPYWDGQAASVPPSMAFVDGIGQGDELLDAWEDDALDWIDPEQDML